jgi:nitrate reductase NapD
MNISSVIVNAQPGRTAVVRSGLEQTAGVEVHAVSEDGKFIVTIETDTDGETVGVFDRINALEGVMSVAMVYHQFESDPEREVCK